MGKTYPDFCAENDTRRAVLDLVAAMEQCSMEAAVQKLRQLFGLANQPPAQEREAINGQAAALAPLKGRNLPLYYKLEGIDPTHAYLGERGVSRQTAEQFSVGFFPGRGSMSGRVVIPIHDKEGWLVAYAGRAIDGSEPKYELSPAFDSSIELFNVCRAIECERRIGNGEVIVVKGFFDCLRVHQAGFPAVAVMGNTLSKEQARLLFTNFQRAVLMFDGDAAGVDATGRAVYQLSLDMFVRVADVGEDRQLDQCSEEKIQELIMRWDYTPREQIPTSELATPRIH